MATIVSIIVLALILFFACRYIYKSKKKGAKCIGCPYCQSGESCPKCHQNQ